MTTSAEAVQYQTDRLRITADTSQRAVMLAAKQAVLRASDAMGGAFFDEDVHQALRDLADAQRILWLLLTRPVDGTQGVVGATQETAATS